MTNPKVSIITPSYNKARYVLDGIDSILKQTYPDFEYWIIENSTDKETRKIVKEKAKTDPRIVYVEEDYTDEERGAQYITAYILNQYLPKLKGKYILYMSDDDLLQPDCLKDSVAYMEDESEEKRWVSYHSQLLSRVRDDGSFEQVSTMKASVKRGFNSVNPQVDCMLDGGQMMMRRECLDYIEQPYYPTDLPNASHCDGLFMEKLAKHFSFWPIPNENKALSIHRRVNESTWVKPWS